MRFHRPIIDSLGHYITCRNDIIYFIMFNGGTSEKGKPLCDEKHGGHFIYINENVDEGDKKICMSKKVESLDEVACPYCGCTYREILIQEVKDAV